MCGVLGFAGRVRRGAWRQTHSLISALLRASAVRGEDATGFAAVTDPSRGTANRLVSDKLPLPADSFASVSAMWRGMPRVRLLIAHTRMATSGSPLININNHPHRSVSGRLSLVHNGMVNDHRGLAARLGLRLVSDCDSELLLRLVEVSHGPVLGLQACLSLTTASMAVALLDAQRQVIYLTRNEGRPLWLCHLIQGGWLFASDPKLLATAFHQTLGDYRRHTDALFPLGSGTVLSLTADGRLMLAPPIPPASETSRKLLA